MMERVSGHPPRMWGTSMVGFGHYRYEYESGRQGEAMLVGFSSRKTSLVIYVMDGFSRHAALMAKLGVFKTGKYCLYVKSLDDVDGIALERLLAASVADMRVRHDAA